MKYWSLIVLLLLCCASLPAQAPYRLGSRVADMPLAPVLNRAEPATRFDSLRGRITILDFFGTWCAPCVRALPHLQALQDKYPDSLRIVLVSTESPAKLRAFLAKNPLRLPLVSDSTEAFTARFAPPSYPYTLVLDAGGNIIDVTQSGSITDGALAYWLSKNSNVAAAGTNANTTPGAAPPARRSADPVMQLSQDFVYAARTGEAIDSFERRLRDLTGAELKSALTDDKTKKAFWINLYNGFVQALLRKDTTHYNRRREFFSTKRFYVSGHALSLDDIEHGILRRSRTWSGGVAYIRVALPDVFETAQRVDKVDYRIHFALNCGAKSCPPIAYYSPADIDKQLDVATNNYLRNEVVSSPSDNIVDVPAIMGWFRNDFGGKPGIRKLLQEKGFIRAGANPNLRFQPYNWTLELNTKTIN
ncbi:MAG: DUF547 domain-containing protein [Chitinophagaceae bacterium]|nr:MAG: DUF547 domain-containing protein [Chitinophagaceae bacterium]